MIMAVLFGYFLGSRALILREKQFLYCLGNTKDRCSFILCVKLSFKHRGVEILLYCDNNYKEITSKLIIGATIELIKTLLIKFFKSFEQLKLTSVLCYNEQQTASDFYVCFIIKIIHPSFLSCHHVIVVVMLCNISGARTTI